MSLESEVQKLTVAANEQTAASQSLSQEVAQKMGEIDQTVTEAEQRTDAAIASVNAAIPDALNTGLNLRLFIDSANGDDTTADGTQSKPFKTLKALLDWAPVGANIRIDGIANDQVIDIDESITLIKKDVTFTSTNCVFNFDASISLHNSKFRMTYKNTINQNVENAFNVYSSSVNLTCNINPGAGASGLIKVNNTYYGYIRSPLTDVYYDGEITDASDPYYIIDYKYGGTAYIVLFGAVTLGANCALFDPTLGSVQIGTKNGYLLGG